MFSKLKHDLPAGLVVFLVALPLCLGVALASGAPLLAGVIAGIIGGILVGFVSDSHTSVSGPAAGLAAVVLSAITNLGSFEIFLLAVVIAGSIQLVSGILKAGFIANYIPSNVIKGLLAAIGIILILKQIPHAVGYDQDIEEDFTFIQKDGHNTFSELFFMLNYFQWGALIVSLISMGVMVAWEKTPLHKLKFLPASLFIVILGALLNLFFEYFIPGLFIEASHTVNIPKFESVGSLITLPDFTSITNYNVWLTAITIAIIASLETLLNLEAVENIDPHKRVASPNKELIAQGIGNMTSGFLGGIPITSVIVRSSVNINAGGQTKVSTILHGIFLLVSLLFLGPILNFIPLASLAIILIFTGYKLAQKKLFVEMYKKGANQFIPFIATVVGIVFTDLLIGIVIGSVVSIFYLLKSNFKNPFTVDIEKLSIGDTIRIELSSQVSFFSKDKIKETLWNIPEDSKVIIDATYSDFIDDDVLELLKDFKNTVAFEKNIQLNIIGVKDHYDLDNQIQFSNALNKETQQKLTPNEIIGFLQAGNDRFVHGKSTEKYFKLQMHETTYNQSPIAAVVSCIDSRTSPELIFDVGLGDVVSIRIAGNIINKEIIESIELSCKELGTKLIVVLGHSNCGAVAYTINHKDHGELITSVADKIERAISACNADRSGITSDKHIFDKVIKLNATNSIQDILSGSEYLHTRIKNNDLKIVAAFYDTGTGIVTFEK